MSTHWPMSAAQQGAGGSTPKSTGAAPFCALCDIIPNFFDRSPADSPVSTSPSGRKRRNAANKQKKPCDEGTFSNLNQWRSSAASASSSSSSSSHVNHMFQSLGVEFEKDELISSRGGDVVTRGDAHLGKLASACELQLQRLLARRSGGNLPESVGGEHSPTAMSAAEWARKMASVSLTYSEVLQLQSRPKEALEAMQAAQLRLEACVASDDSRNTVGLVLVREADLMAISWGQKVDDQDPPSPPPSPSCVTLDPSGFTASSPGVFRVMGDLSLGGATSASPRLGSVTRAAAKFLQPYISCLLRIGSLLITLGRMQEALRPLQSFVAVCKALPPDLLLLEIEDRQIDLSSAYALLAVSLDALGRSDEAAVYDSLGCLNRVKEEEALTLRSLSHG